MMKLYVRFVDVERGGQRWKSCELIQVPDDFVVRGCKLIGKQAVPLGGDTVIHLGREVNIVGAPRQWRYVEISRSIRFGNWDGPYPGKRIIKTRHGGEDEIAVSDEGEVLNVIISKTVRSVSILNYDTSSRVWKGLAGRMAIPGHTKNPNSKQVRSFLVKNNAPVLVLSDEDLTPDTPNHISILSCPKEAMMTKLPLPARLRMVMIAKLHLSPVQVDDLFQEAELLQFPQDLEPHRDAAMRKYYDGTSRGIGPLHLPMACLVSRLDPCAWCELTRKFVPLVHLGGCNKHCPSHKLSYDDLKERAGELEWQVLDGVDNWEIIGEIDRLMVESTWQPKDVHENVQDWEGQIEQIRVTPEQYMESQIRARGIKLFVDAPEFKAMATDDTYERALVAANDLIERLKISVAVTDEQRMFFERRMNESMVKLRNVALSLATNGAEIFAADVQGEVMLMNNLDDGIIWPGTPKILTYYYRGMISASVRVGGRILAPRPVTAVFTGDAWVNTSGPFDPRDYINYDAYVPSPVFLSMEEEYMRAANM